MSKRIVELERAHQENTMLKSSIIQFREDVQRQRAHMHSSIPPSGRGVSSGSDSLRSKLMSISLHQGSLPTQQTSAASSNKDVEIQHLYQKNAILELELSKAQEIILAQQKKWDKLKETVKKKREGKTSSSQSASDSISIFTDNLQPEQVAAISSHAAGDRSSGNPSNPLSPSSSSLYFSTYE